jgi:hypothetical protein
MASHGGHDERRRAALLEIVAHFLDQHSEVVNSTTAGGDGDPGARPNDVVERCRLRPQRPTWIVETSAIKPLPDFEELIPPHVAAQL